LRPVSYTDVMEEALSPPAPDERKICRYGAKCRKLDDELHCELCMHPGKDGIEVSREGDQHAGARFPRRQCMYHPGCPFRNNCFYSHGLVQTPDSQSSWPTTCFLGQAPHNRGCFNPTWNGKPFEFCSTSCKERAKETPKGPLGCRREDCPCPCTDSGIGGGFCCDTCAQGTACSSVTHLLPSAHLAIIAKAKTPAPEGPGASKYAPCVRDGCACGGEGGSSWDGKPGGYCCRACRNGTPCTTLWHTLPESVALENTETAYVSYKCALESCNRSTWNGQPNEYCCLEHRHEGMGDRGNALPTPPSFRTPEEEAAAEPEPAEVAPEESEEPEDPAFPNYRTLQRSVRSWAKSHGGGAQKGKISGIWWNESLDCRECPARVAFEKAVEQAKLDDWSDGEFGWHGTKSMGAIQGICWNSWDTVRRSGQACGPGEYFSRGTKAGLHYSEGYAGGDAGHVLIIAWVMSHRKGAAPRDSKRNGACGGASTGHIVCCNPVQGAKKSTGVMYCVPVAVVGFGVGGKKPTFKLSPQGDVSTHPSGVVITKTIGRSVMCALL